MRAFVAVTIALLGIAGPSSAYAQCDAPYSADKLLEDLGNVESFLQNGDNDAASAAAKGMEGKIGCLGELLPAMILGRTYRGIGAGLYVGGNLSRSKDWFASAISVDPTFEYGIQDLPAEHPVVSLFGEVKRVGLDPAVTVEGKAFVAGVHYLDGKKVSTPSAAPAMPHLYQKESDGSISSWLIEGEYFPETVLTNSGSSAANTTDPKGGKEPKGNKNSTGSTPPVSTVTTISRKRPPEKTPLMIGGTAILGGAGAVYFLATVARDQFDNAETQEEVTRLKGKTNSMVVLSAVVLGVGAGTLSWGVIVSDQGTPLPAVNLRF